MKKYIEQLLADLAAATQNLPPKPNYKVLYPDHPAHDFGLEYIVAWECTPFQPMTELFGIAANAFPSEDKLTDEQVEKVVDAILLVWHTYNNEVIIPEDVPNRLLYTVLVHAWGNKRTQFVPLDMGRITVDCCTSEIESCPWGEFCSCIELAAELNKEHEDFERRLNAGEFKGIEPPITDYMSFYNYIHREEGGDLPF